MSRLSELPLAIGQALQLTAVEQSQVKLYARLMGYVEDRSIIVTAPLMYGGLNKLVAGDALVVRTFTSKEAYVFRTSVQQVATAPFAHLFLDYPRRIENAAARKASRVIVKRYGTLTGVGPEGLTNEPALIVDLSQSGAGVECREHFAKVGEPVVLSIPADPTIGQPDLRLRTFVRVTRPTQSGPGEARAHYGLEFAELKPEQASALATIVQPHRAEEA